MKIKNHKEIIVVRWKWPEQFYFSTDEKWMFEAFVDGSSMRLPPLLFRVARKGELLEPCVLSHFWAHAVNKAISDLRMARVSKPV